MRSVVHISDVHFGKVDRETIQPLVKFVHELRPNLVVVSGDLTQRAKKKEYKLARQFLLSLPGPQIVVPGNHDVPVWNPVNRFLRPLANFKRFITPNLYPFYLDDEIAVLGINTARSTTTKYGHINKKQLLKVQEILGPVPEDRIKIVVTHHPFDIPKGYRNIKQIVGKSRRAMKVFAELGADMFLAGHLHTVFTGQTAERYKIENHNALIIQAGTATAHKGSSEANSFNLIECKDSDATVTRIEWRPGEKKFARDTPKHYRHSEAGWIAES